MHIIRIYIEHCITSAQKVSIRVLLSFLINDFKIEGRKQSSPSIEFGIVALLLEQPCQCSMVRMYVEFVSNDVGATFVYRPKHCRTFTFRHGIIPFSRREGLGVIGDRMFSVPLYLGKNTSHPLIGEIYLNYKRVMGIRNG